jgi:serine/threonine protein kinase
MSCLADVTFPPCFTDVEKIGQGAYGSVYRARRLPDGRLVALKCFVNDGEAQTASFTIEKLALQKLYHPNVIKYYGDFTIENYLVLELEYIDGQPLGNRLPG